jgi:putative tryptophan/tyrosine transport system substrate-binding protein
MLNIIAHLRGEKPDELPLQAPTKFQLVVNVKAAKETGLEIPATVLAQADEE